MHPSARKTNRQLDKKRLPLDNQTMASGAYLEETAVQRVAVDIDACRRLSTLIRSRHIPADHEDSSLDGITPREIGNFYLLLVAICHQTSPRGRPPLEGKVGERHFRGWDYLSAKLEAAVRENPDILSPDYWATRTPAPGIVPLRIRCERQEEHHAVGWGRHCRAEPWQGF